MKRLPILALLATMLWLNTSCDYFKSREVKAGLNNSLEQLPQLRDFGTITMIKGSSAIKSCHYAEAEVVLGTFLKEEDALEVYVDGLEALGWLERGKQDELHKGMVRGAHERIEIRAGYPNLDVQENKEYVRMKDSYPTIIFVRLVFYLPQRDGC
jgi:hypothetical protein